MNGNANGKNQLKRMELEFRGNSYVFTLNPEVYDIETPNRVNMVNTKAGAWIDLFGAGVKQINISGTTGFKNGSGDPDDGYNKFISLRRLIEDNFKSITDGSEVKDFVTFYNHTDGDAFITVPIKLKIYRNVNQPLLYKYDLSFYVVRNAGDPAPSTNIQVLGNPFGSPSTGAQTVSDVTKVEGAWKTVTADNKVNIQQTKDVVTVVNIGKDIAKQYVK